MALFKRAELARKLVDRIVVGSKVAADSGLFLSAPRRTGKSTFIREDLRPELGSRGLVVIYADLWEDKQADPAKVVISAIKAELAKHEGVLARIARATGVEKVSVGGVAFSLDHVGLNQDVSLSAALEALSDELQKPIALIIDEVQHAITTKDGNDMLFALKAARDEVNSSRHHGLHIIATGSSQAKLAMLKNSKDQAFFGAHIMAFPHLDRAYVEWFCHHQLFGQHLDVNTVVELFVKADYRPEILTGAAKAIEFDVLINDEDIPDRFAEEVEKQIAGIRDSLLRLVNSLTPVQYSVLKVMAMEGDDFAPFMSETIALYNEILQERSGNNQITMDVPSAQQALAALQEKGLVWKESRGVYALEDQAVIDLLKETGRTAMRPY